MIAIIGAGLAGLSVAEGLVRKRLAKPADIVIFERYPNVGGRVVTNRDPLQYEIGAGRIAAGHKRVHGLIQRFGLQTYPIAGDVVWRGVGGSLGGSVRDRERKEGEGPSDVGDGEAGFQGLRRAIVQHLRAQSAEALATHTVADFVCPTWRPALLRFPYWAEIHMLRADLALEAFEEGGEMSSYGGYTGVKQGLDAITMRLAAAVQDLGIEIRTRHRVADVRGIASKGFVVKGDAGKKAEAEPFEFRADKVIIATCRCSLGKFSVLKGKPLLRQLQTSPLMRIYAVYPPSAPGGKAWFAGLPKTVTDSPLRYVIPIDERKGLIMISYTDGPTDTQVWRDLEGKSLERALAKEVKKVFGVDVGPATYLQKHDWPSGCTYWTPGRYSVEEAIAEAMFPAEGIFVVGESVSRTQAWMESALESAETLLKHWP